tara:strand:+ start:813 stop:1661 length:849 start_codon:yes stop_codon:yes gene_type:complete
MSNDIQHKKGNVSDIIKMIDRANETFVYEIFIPSLGKEVMFREINTSQQQRLVKAIIDSPAYNTEFIFAIRNIIKENCTDEAVDIGSLTIFDKMVICMRMRSMSISNDLDLQFTSPKSEKVITRRIDLNDLVKLAVEKIHIEPATIVDEKGNFQISCSMPSIDDEYGLERELRDNVESIQIQNEKELRQTVGQVFTNEIVKYIKQINIKQGDAIVEVDLKGMSFTDRLAILAQIPAKVNNQIVDYIDSVSKEFQKITLVKEEVEGETIEQRLKIDASFFTVS